MEGHFASALPAVMVFSGMDPTGASGMQANIETLRALNCHCLPITTCITRCDAEDLQEVYPLPTTLVIEQARAIMENIPVAACKIDLLGSPEIAISIHTLLNDYPQLPVIFDPFSEMGPEFKLPNDELIEIIKTLLLPLTNILVVNYFEAQKLAPQADTIDACAQVLLDFGCDSVLITGHQEKNQIINYFYSNRRQIKQFPWRHLPFVYQGAGCTLSASIAGYTAQKLDPSSSVHEGQRYTAKALERAYRLGLGRLIPNRLFWIQLC